MLAFDDAAKLWDVEWWLAAIGFAGQGCFAGRFAIQWLISERAGRSTIPVVFWYISIVGSLVMMAYGILRKDPVIVVGQTTGTIVYVRNLMLLSREQRDAGGS